MTEQTAKIILPDDVIMFWLDAGPSKWWKKDDAFDAEISKRFGSTLNHAAQGDLIHWTENPDGTLALILVFDQFSRNLFRNDPRAFAQDPQALALTKQAMSDGQDRMMHDDIGVFCYLPLMHSENLNDQKTCLAQMQRLNLVGNVKAAKEHLDIIERFGRFPHRNDVLGRTTTPEEAAFLDAGGFAG